MANFYKVNSDKYLIEAKSYTISNAIKYGIEKAIILNTLENKGLGNNKEMHYYFPEFKKEDVDKHLSEMQEMGLIFNDRD